MKVAGGKNGHTNSEVPVGLTPSVHLHFSTPLVWTLPQQTNGKEGYGMSSTYMHVI